ncbi:MAG: hypothetical protein HRT91_03505 [Piscirickettsiaceae bacterium]|nr:hypothetical protein [Piscirickettsiaceae bacterium]
MNVARDIARVVVEHDLVNLSLFFASCSCSKFGETMIDFLIYNFLI